MVQWLRHCASTVGGMGLISGRGTEILHTARCSQKIEKKEKLFPFVFVVPLLTCHGVFIC